MYKLYPFLSFILLLFIYIIDLYFQLDCVVTVVYAMEGTQVTLEEINESIAY